MNNLTFQFYSVLKNEDAIPYVGNNLLVIADGLGGSGSTVHAIDRVKHPNLHDEIRDGIYYDVDINGDVNPDFAGYVQQLMLPMEDDEDDTSALWASRIAIARCVYALTPHGDFYGADLGDERVRAELTKFITAGLDEVARNFKLEKGRYDAQLVLPTTLAFIRYTETEKVVKAEVVWAGDSRCYLLMPNGLKLLSVDDEDESGSITNLFYAGNKKAKLNYRSYDIEKPCALLVVSDGVFDPFDPYDYLEVENSILSALKVSNSTEELAEVLKSHFDAIHSDDATMAFAAFGFADFADMRNRLAARTEEIRTISERKQGMQGTLEVMNQSEEEVAHYVQSRTRDRYDYIVSMLLETIRSGTSDIALSPEITKIVKDAEKEAYASLEKAKKQRREEALSELDNYAKEQPELIISEILAKSDVDFGGDVELAKAFQALKRGGEERSNLTDNKDLLKEREELAAKRADLHSKIMERVTFYRERFDALWDNNPSHDFGVRSEAKMFMCQWQDIDCSLQFGLEVTNIEWLPEEERALAYAVEAFDNNRYKKVDILLRAGEGHANKARKECLSAWGNVVKRLKNDFSLVSVLLSPEALQKFGLDDSDESFMAVHAKEIREKVLRELKAKKEVIVPDIVKACAENYDKTSVIDGQYNATRLTAFRTYYRMKANADEGPKALEAKLVALEAEHVRWLK